MKMFRLLLVLAVLATAVPASAQYIGGTFDTDEVAPFKEGEKPIIPLDTKDPGFNAWRTMRDDLSKGREAGMINVQSASVNHFGHVRYRQNRYEAALHVIAVEGAWKIAGIELIDEKRLL